MLQVFRKGILGVALVAFSVAVLLYARLFRTVEVSSPTAGDLFLEYSWGALSSVHVDFNRDGLVDFVGKYPPLAGGYDFDDPPMLEFWQATKCDGVFDFHLVYAYPTKDVILVEVNGTREAGYKDKFHEMTIDHARNKFLSEECPTAKDLE